MKDIIKDIYWHLTQSTMDQIWIDRWEMLLRRVRNEVSVETREINTIDLKYKITTLYNVLEMEFPDNFTQSIEPYELNNLLFNISPTKINPTKLETAWENIKTNDTCKLKKKCDSSNFKNCHIFPCVALLNKIESYQLEPTPESLIYRLNTKYKETQFTYLGAYLKEFCSNKVFQNISAIYFTFYYPGRYFDNFNMGWSAVSYENKNDFAKSWNFIHWANDNEMQKFLSPSIIIKNFVTLDNDIKNTFIKKNWAILNKHQKDYTNDAFSTYREFTIENKSHILNKGILFLDSQTDSIAVFSNPTQKITFINLYDSLNQPLNGNADNLALRFKLFLSRIFENKEWSCEAYIRIPVFSDLESKQGADIFIAFNDSNPKLIYNLILDITEPIDILASIINNRMNYKASDESAKENAERTSKIATFAAISQVMARNMSHNIGSHVLSKLISVMQLMGILKDKEDWQCQTNTESENKKETIIDELQNIVDKFKNECSANEECKSMEDCFNSIIQTLNKFETQPNSNYSFLATFFDYLKARMDYLADVTTNIPVIENTKGIVNDIIKPFLNNRVLNDRISGIDAFSYRIIVCKPPQNHIEHCISHSTEKCHTTTNIINSSNDITLSIPNDVLGAHAFYTILENIIRNSAKHGTTPVRKDGNNKDVKVPFEFKIKVEEATLYQKKNENNNGSKIYWESEDLDWNEFYAISIFDNCDLTACAPANIADWTNEKKNRAGLDKTCNEIPRLHELVANQNENLNTSILDEDKLRHGAWGLIEMDASAAYLRKIDIELIDSNQYDIRDLTGNNPITQEGELAIFQAYAEQGKYLGYRFFVRKPQEVLIVADDENLSLTDEQKEEKNKKDLFKKYKNSGVWIYNKVEFKKFIDTNKEFPHKLVVIAGDIYNELKENIDNIKSCFSKRLFIVEKIDLLTDIESFKVGIWKSFLLTTNYKFYKNQRIKHEKEDVKNNNLIQEDAALDDHGQNYCKNIINNRFVEVWTSATEHFFKNAEPLNSLRFASWAIPILVLDERIQDFAWKENYHIQKKQSDRCSEKGGKNKICYHDTGVPYHIIYKNTKINIPDPKKECNLNAQNFHSIYQGNEVIEYKRIIDVIKEFIKKNKERNYFLVIHLGIIEKLIKAYNETTPQKHINKDDKAKTAEFIKQEVLGNDNLTEYDNIVVTSGRGTPDNIPEGIRYLNFSVVSQYMITIRNKYAFTEALYSARTSNKS